VGHLRALLIGIDNYRLGRRAVSRILRTSGGEYERGEYEIWDPSGQPILDLNPPLRPSHPASPVAVAQPLIDLTKFNTVLQFTNHDQSDELNGKLLVEILSFRPDNDVNNGPRPMPFSRWGNTPIVPKAGGPPSTFASSRQGHSA
jgi:hypothetical protein